MTGSNNPAHIMMTPEQEQALERLKKHSTGYCTNHAKDVGVALALLRTALEDSRRLDWREANPAVVISKSNTQTVPLECSDGTIVKPGHYYWRLLWGVKDKSNRFSTYRQAIDAAATPTRRGSDGILQWEFESKAITHWLKLHEIPPLPAQIERLEYTFEEWYRLNRNRQWTFELIADAAWHASRAQLKDNK